MLTKKQGSIKGGSMLRGQDEFTGHENSKVRIKVIVEKCISAATCVIKAPNTFDLDEEGIAFVQEMGWNEAVDIVLAARSCPTNAIIIEDLEGNQLWPTSTKNKN